MRKCEFKEALDALAFVRAEWHTVSEDTRYEALARALVTLLRWAEDVWDDLDANRLCGITKSNTEDESDEED